MSQACTRSSLSVSSFLPAMLAACALCACGGSKTESTANPPSTAGAPATPPANIPAAAPAGPPDVPPATPPDVPPATTPDVPPASPPAVPPPAPLSSDGRVWVAPPTTKIRPAATRPADAARGAQISAAKNEFQSFQIVITGAATDVWLSLPDLSDGNGHAIGGRDIMLYREALTDVGAPSGGDGATGLWPDALIPDVDSFVGEKRNAFPFSVPAGESRAVLIDIHVPIDAPAGAYFGRVLLSGGVSDSVPVTLKVWNFAIPSTATLRSAFGMNWNGPCLGHGDGSCGKAAAETVLRNRYVTAALDNRFSIDTPEMGSPVADDGSTRWAEFDSSAGPFLDGTAPTRLPGARLTSLRAQTPSGSLSSGAARAWGQHFRDKGWLSALFNMVCDEPPIKCAFSDINSRIEASHAGDPGIPTMVTTSVTRGQQNGVQGVDLYAPIVNWMEDRPGYGGPYENSQRDNYGATVWWYQSCMSHGCARPTDDYGRRYFSGWPTMQVDADGSRYRAQEWLSYLYGISGMFYFETTGAYAKGDPWVNQDDFGAWGDGTLFYPGTPAKIGGQTEIPVESLRMKGIRDGEQDYELLVLARARGHGPEAWEIARSVFRRTFESNATPQALENARQKLAALIGG